MNEWHDLGNLFGTTFVGKRALKKEKNDSGQVRVVLHALCSTTGNWEPIFTTAPFEDEAAFRKWIDNKIEDPEVGMNDPELAVALLMHDMLYCGDMASVRKEQRAV